MSKRLLYLIGGAAMLFAVSVPAHAQQHKPKKHPNQAVDKGVDSDAPSAEAVDKNVAAVPITFHANGMISAQLDESFEEAMVVTRNADGTLAATCIHGLPAAAQHVETAKPSPSPTASKLEEK